MSSPSLRELQQTIEGHTSRLEEQSAWAADAKALEELRNQFLSRKRGVVTLLFERLKTFSPQDRREAGRLLNGFKDGGQSDPFISAQAKLREESYLLILLFILIGS